MLPLEVFRCAVDKINIPFLFLSPVYKFDSIIDFKITYSNRFFNKNIYDVTKVDFIKSIDFEVVLCNDFFKMALDSAQKSEVVNFTSYNSLKGIWYSIEVNPISIDCLVVTMVDISAKMYYSEQLKKSSCVDVLTALPNRIQFYKDIKSINLKCIQENKKYGLFIFDIDNFKAINDTKGHQEGDRALIKSARILKSIEDNNINVYRFTADEFLVVYAGIDEISKFYSLGEKIISIFDNERISVSGGFSVFPDNSKESNELINFADLAMHNAKKAGKHQLMMFTQEMQSKFLRSEMLKSKMQTAFTKGEFELFFQPQFDISSSKLRGFEALLRWNESVEGLIGPDEFIPLAEENNFILILGEWVLKKAFECQKKWEQKFNFDGIMSINVSPIQLMKEDFVQKLSSLSTECNVNPSNIEIEVTEGIFINETEKAAEILREIKKLGFGISLDDFGTGYSSLKYLQMLPLTTLKIDKSFIQSITSKDGVSENITNSIISMVTKMGIDTIAEGVEKVDQLLILQQLNCKTIQGFLRGKPMDELSVEKFLLGEIKL